MPIQEYLKASGVRVHAGEQGLIYKNVGRIYNDRGSIKGIDSHLFAILKIAVDWCALVVRISSVDTGRHAPNSRHYRGCAVDIWKVGKIGGDPEAVEEATPQNKDAMTLLFWLRSAGFQYGERRNGQSVPGLLFGPARSKYCPADSDHSDHLHVSLPAPKRR